MLIHGDFKLVCNEAARMGKIIRMKSKEYVSYFFEIRGDIYFTHIEKLPFEVSEAFRVELLRGFNKTKALAGCPSLKRSPSHLIPIHRNT